MNKGIQVGQYVIVRNSKLKANGILKGKVLYVAGDAIVSVSEKDPYELRRILVGCKVDDRGFLLVDDGGFTVDAKNVKVVDDQLQAELDMIRAAQFADEVGVDEGPECGTSKVSSDTTH